MRIARASEAVGAMVENVDVNRLNDQEFAAIRQAFLDHGALFFRDQTLTPEDHIAFAERWGAIDFNRFFKQRTGYREIADVLKEPDHDRRRGFAVARTVRGKPASRYHEPYGILIIRRDRLPRLVESGKKFGSVHQ